MHQPNPKYKPRPRLRKRLPRMTAWSAITLLLLLLLAVIRPEQLQVVLYKAGLVTLGAVLAYWIDRSLYPHQRPHECIGGIHIVGAWLRRALVVLACVLGLTLGL